MSVWQIDLFGTFEVRHNGDPVAGLEARKAQELLAFLLIQRSQTYSREFLAEMLWGQRAPAQSKKYLRQTLWQVQSALASNGRDATEACPFVVQGNWVHFDERCDLWLDVAIFEAAYAQTQGLAGSDLDDAHAACLRDAVQLYRGDLLQGCYEDWCIFERERLQSMYLAMLDKLIDCCQQHGQYEVGLGYGATILRYDRARERTHRRMMRLYYLAGIVRRRCANTISLYGLCGRSWTSNRHADRPCCATRFEQTVSMACSRRPTARQPICPGPRQAPARSIPGCICVICTAA
jgi:DNA-binding SARP family transcriptional activator